MEKRQILTFGLCWTVLLSISCNKPMAERTEKEMPAAFVPNPLELPEKPVQKLKIGNKAPFFNLPNVNGKFTSIDDFEEAKVLVINIT